MKNEVHKNSLLTPLKFLFACCFALPVLFAFRFKGYAVSMIPKITAFITIISLLSCQKFKEYNQKPELESLRQGLRASAAIGYCVSIATAAYKGQMLPDNVTIDESTGLIHIKIDQNHPLPYCNKFGDIILACLWNTNGGIMSILFGDFDILGGDIKLYGLYTIPFIERTEQDGILAIFAKQDIILGYGSDTILELGNITDPMFRFEMDRLDADEPSDAFVAVTQNVWFIHVDQNLTSSDVYDDLIRVTGGGQIAEVIAASGGIEYHALINAKMNYSTCSKNPISGNGLTQNVKAGGQPNIDLGNSYFSFHANCDGMVHVELSTGKYLQYTNKDIPLEIQ
jgi:hypothetical protein